MAADEAGRQEGQARIYGPRRCGPDGATECPCVVLGRLEEDGAGGQRIRVLEPAECATRWPVLDLDAVTSYDGLPHGGPRRLEPHEVRSLVALRALGRPRQ
jgi:hypothetical protein